LALNLPTICILIPAGRTFMAAEGDLDSERPECQQCGARMMLSRIEPYPIEDPKYERRTFECERCGRSESYVIELHLRSTRNAADMASS